ncbi:MAG: hypothetical protein AAGA12_12600 [Pseudomonadota bacterium]
MKTLIATTVIALSLSVPAVAQVGNPAAFFALNNDSAAERILGNTSVGDTAAAESKIAAYNDSPAENTVVEGSQVTRGQIDQARAFFALDNDSAAERIVK